MTNKQKKKWEEVYANMLAISELKPWQRIHEDIPVIYQKKDCDEPVIFSIRGFSGGLCGVTCFFSHHDYIFARRRMKRKNFKNEPVIFMQNCIMGIWSDLDNVMKENREVIGELGLEFGGKDGMLSFETLKERCEPRCLTYDETVLLADALENLKCLLEAVSKNELRVNFAKGETVIRCSDDDGVWHNAVMKYDDIVNSDPIAVWDNSERIAELAEMPVSGRVVELEERCMSVTVRDDKTGEMFYPLMVGAADAKSGESLVLKSLTPNDERSEALLDVIVEICEKFGKPKQIRINDELTRYAVKDLCERVGIKLNYQQKPLKTLEKVFEEAFDEGMLFGKAEKTEQVSETCGRVTDVGEGDTQTFVISVSLGKGLYRHIKISGGATLEELHSVILDSFGFDDDHAHVFFLDNKAWSDEGYYASYMEDKDRFSCDYTLSRVLEEKQSFLYIFDFGEEWRFKCKVLSIKEGACPEAEIVRSVGAAPEQYPDNE